MIAEIKKEFKKRSEQGFLHYINIVGSKNNYI